VPSATWGMARLDPAASLDMDQTALGRALLEYRETTYSGLQVREVLPLQIGPESLTLFCFPLFVNKQPIGMLCLVAQASEVQLSEDQRVFTRAVADLLMIAVQSSSYRQRLARESERMVAFEQLGGLLSGSRRLEQALEQVLRVAARVTDSAHGTLLLLESDESRVRFRVTLKEGDVLPLSVTAPPILKHGLAGWALRERRADIVEDNERDARWLPVPGLATMRSALVVPLLYGERALGILTLADPTPRHYSQRSLAICSALSAHAVTILAREQYEEMIASGSATLARRLFEGHLSPNRLAALLADTQRLHSALDPQTRELVVIYAGLRGLERVQLTPVELFAQILTPCVDTLSAIGHEHHGYLLLRDDGAMLMLFGYPAAQADIRVRAMRAAQAVQVAARRLRGRWHTQLGCDVSLSAGVATGPLVAGVVGNMRYQAVGVVGSTIGEAARIQRMARADEVLVTDTLAASLGVETLFPLERLAPLAGSAGEPIRFVYRLAPGRA
jgi:class 3 adenylate cyclase